VISLTENQVTILLYLEEKVIRKSTLKQTTNLQHCIEYSVQNYEQTKIPLLDVGHIIRRGLCTWARVYGWRQRSGLERQSYHGNKANRAGGRFVCVCRRVRQVLKYRASSELHQIVDEGEDVRPCNLASFFWRGVSLFFIPENAYTHKMEWFSRTIPQ
jgi:hypothetical protein